MKPKKVWKLSPYEPFEVDAIAGWMDEMSHQGLQFCTKVGPFCRFESRPGPARYRVDPRRSEDGRTEEERTALFGEDCTFPSWSCMPSVGSGPSSSPQRNSTTYY